MARIVIDPVGRVEGHLKIDVTVDNGEVKDARVSGPMFRGFEQILIGRHPMDAQRLTTRVCGVCPAVHSVCSSLALDGAIGVADQIPDNGRIIRNLLLGANFLQSHILHFYALAALDYVDPAAAADYAGDDPGLQQLAAFLQRGEWAPFVPRYEGDLRLDKETNATAASHYLRALDMRRLTHEMVATFGGKMPHEVGCVPGGTCEVPTTDKIASFLGRLQDVQRFVDECYVPDILAVAKAYPDYFEIGKGCGKYLAYGLFDMDTTETDLMKRPRYLPSGALNGQLEAVDAQAITEDLKYSHFSDEDSHLRPSEGRTQPQADKPEAYSWAKAPRLNGEPYEVGPLARWLVAYHAGDEKVKPVIDSLLAALDAEPAALQSTLGRHAARALETKLVADAMAQWVLELEPGAPVCADYELPETGSGTGMVDGPRGALLHHIDIEDSVISRYQLVVPTTWNVSPRDDQDKPGPIEQALVGTSVRDEQNPFEVVRIARSFDPCLACAVHIIDARDKELGRYRIL